MRVLTLGNMYPPHHFGGYELVWRSAVEHLRGAGHEVRVLTTDTRTGAHGSDPPHVFRQLRWRLVNGSFQDAGRRALVALARYNHRVLEEHVQQFRPDTVAWWSMGGLTLTMLESVRRRGLPAVAFVHDDWLDYGRWADGWLNMFAGRRALLRPVAERILGIPGGVDFGHAATYLFVSEHTRRHALAQDLGLRETGIAHSGIQETFLDPAPVQPWEWRLLYVGRLDQRKGIETAVEAMVFLPEQATLTVVGGWNPDEEDRLRRRAGELAVRERVNFAGQHDRREISAAYGEADAVLFPVRWEEPWGLVPLEAMARGRPVVASGRGGSGEYLRDAENCLLADPDDPRALARTITRLAEDPQLRGRLRDGGLQTAPHHTESGFNARVERALIDRDRGRW